MLSAWKTWKSESVERETTYLPSSRLYNINARTYSHHPALLLNELMTDRRFAHVPISKVVEAVNHALKNIPSPPPRGDAVEHAAYVAEDRRIGTYLKRARRNLRDEPEDERDRMHGPANSARSFIAQSTAWNGGRAFYYTGPTPDWCDPERFFDAVADVWGHSCLACDKVHRDSGLLNREVNRFLCNSFDSHYHARYDAMCRTCTNAYGKYSTKLTVRRRYGEPQENRPEIEQVRFLEWFNKYVTDAARRVAT